MHKRMRLRRLAGLQFSTIKMFTVQFTAAARENGLRGNTKSHLVLQQSIAAECNARVTVVQTACMNSRGNALDGNRGRCCLPETQQHLNRSMLGTEVVVVYLRTGSSV